MYAAYALSSIMTPTQPLVGMRAAGVIPALVTVLTTSRVLASKKGAMRALGRLARSEEAAVEIVEANGLPPIIALLDCDDAGLVRRYNLTDFLSEDHLSLGCPHSRSLMNRQKDLPIIRHLLKKSTIFQLRLS